MQRLMKMYHLSRKKQYHRTALKAVQPAMDQIGQLTYRVSHNGVESNILEWMRIWKDYQITEFPTTFCDCLRRGQRKTYDIDEEI